MDKHFVGITIVQSFLRILTLKLHDEFTINQETVDTGQRSSAVT